MTAVFLTGASGFVGAHLLRELHSAGAEVRALSRRPETDAGILAAGGIPVRGTLGEPASLREALEGCEAVFHAAGDTSVWRRDAQRQHATNVEGTRALLGAAMQANVQAFLFTSSVSAYSHLAEGVITEETPQRGSESWIAYERTKYLAEQLVREGPLPWTVFQPTNILGPGDRQNWARLIVMIDKQTLPGVPPGIGSFADVRQVAKAQVEAWQRGKFGRAYILGGEHASYLEFARIVGAMLRKPTPEKVTSSGALMAYARVLDAVSRITGKEPRLTPEGAMLGSQQRRVDHSRAVAELGYEPTPLEPLLEDTVAWMRAQRLID